MKDFNWINAQNLTHAERLAQIQREQSSVPGLRVDDFIITADGVRRRVYNIQDGRIYADRPWEERQHLPEHERSKLLHVTGPYTVVR